MTDCPWPQPPCWHELPVLQAATESLVVEEQPALLHWPLCPTLVSEPAHCPGVAELWAHLPMPPPIPIPGPRPMPIPCPMPRPIPIPRPCPMPMPGPGLCPAGDPRPALFIAGLLLVLSALCASVLVGAITAYKSKAATSVSTHLVLIRVSCSIFWLPIRLPMYVIHPLKRTGQLSPAMIFFFFQQLTCIFLRSPVLGAGQRYDQSYTLI